LLWLAQRQIPIGTAYAVWTGIGIVGTLIIRILLYNKPSTLMRFGSGSLSVLGIIGLKLVRG
jgi:quaternary ammonium compound-resistance protein SugE